MKFRLDAEAERFLAFCSQLETVGRLKGRAFLKGKRILVVNSYNNLLLEKSSEKWNFPTLGFGLDMYEGREFELTEDGAVKSSRSEGGFRVTKVFPREQKEAERWMQLFDSYWQRGRFGSLTLSRDAVSLLDKELSHVEIVVEGGKWRLLQRDLYGGWVRCVEERSLLQRAEGSVRTAFVLRDFLVLFEFGEVRMEFCEGFVKALCGRDVRALLASCDYEGAYEIKVLEEESHGRKEQEDKSRKPESGKATDGGAEEVRQRLKRLKRLRRRVSR